MYGGEYNSPLDGDPKIIIELHMLAYPDAQLKHTSEWKGYTIAS